MARAAAIIVRAQSLALIERHRAGHHYFIFPGGQIEEGESPVETVACEIKEELGLEVIVGNLVAEVIFNGTYQFYFVIDAASGQFGTGQGDEMLGLYPKENGTYAAVWVLLSEILKFDVRLRAVAELVRVSLAQGWPQKTLLIHEEG